MKTHETAVFGGGCFWCTETLFSRLKGVSSVTPGYAGGKMNNPSYEDVSTGSTGHAEVIKIEFDPKVISFEILLDVFWNVHDPTTPNRQGADVGSQYRSVILYTNKEQEERSKKKKAELDKSGKFKNPIVTEIEELDKFYEAEEYHKQFYAKNPSQPYCRLVIDPKLLSFLDKYKQLLK